MPRARPACDARYREIHSTKGHDAFLVEWDQLTALLREALAGLDQRGGRSPPA